MKTTKIRKPRTETLNHRLVQKFGFQNAVDKRGFTKWNRVGCMRVFCTIPQLEAVNAERWECGDGTYLVAKIPSPDQFAHQKWTQEYARCTKPRAIIAIATVKINH